MPSYFSIKTGPMTKVQLRELQRSTPSRHLVELCLVFHALLYVWNLEGALFKVGFIRDKHVEPSAF